MSLYTGQLECVRCHATTADNRPWAGCVACANNNVNANVLPTYQPALGLRQRPDEPGIFMYRDHLPLADDVRPVSLGEGRTPLIETSRLASAVGVSAMWWKDESRNPTWSYKDRLASVAVSVAASRGADTIVLSSTGNHGAAAAAYAAAAGIRCVVFTNESVPRSMKTLMQAYGAHVFALANPTERWTLLEECVKEFNWVPISGYPIPPIGSNPFGVDGYKTIAYEIVQELGFAPSTVVVPTAYADGLAGIERGFRELHSWKMIADRPQLISVDPFGAYAAALSAGSDIYGPTDSRPTPAFSIGTSFATAQGIAALRASRGTAHTIGDDERIMDWQRRVARASGLYLEASSVTAMPALEDLVKTGVVKADVSVVCIGSSTGLKDVEATASRLPEVPLIQPTLAAVTEALARR